MGDPVGPVANFLAGVSFLLSAYYVTKRQEIHHVHWLWASNRYYSDDYRT